MSRDLLRVRWLGHVGFQEADVIQRSFHARSPVDRLLLLEHDHVFTLGSRADPAHVLVPPATVGAQLVQTDRGGDVTYHGPGQLVGYPIVTIPGSGVGIRDVVAYVRHLESAIIAALGDLGVAARRIDRLTGVWVGDDKIAAIGVRVARNRTRHGFALNVDPDLSMFGRIVPCGIRDKGVTSIARVLGVAPPMLEVVDRVAARFADEFDYEQVERQDVAGAQSADARAAVVAAPQQASGRRLIARLEAAGVHPAPRTTTARRPEYLRVKATLGPAYREVQRLMRSRGLHTVCEEAGCPNIYECWADRTATFMILGDRCTRACGFCLVTTAKPGPPDPDEPGQVAEAVAHLALAHVVITSVARDDLADGGAAAFAATVRAVRSRTPATDVELLIPDCKGDPDALETIFAVSPAVLNHNLETVARLQRALRPNASYARSLGVLARAKAHGLVTKSGLILGMGETETETRGAIADLHDAGVDILTLGQYLRPSERHAPVARWWRPDEFDALRDYAEQLGFSHVEAGPLVRSSYHARRAVESTAPLVDAAV